MAERQLKLLGFGLGYVATALAQVLAPRGFAIAGTHRTAEATAAPDHAVALYPYDGTRPIAAAALDGASHLLVSIPPDDQGDPVLRHHRDELTARARQFDWVGYLSTTGVYGDRAGGWVDETAPLEPVTARGRRRVAAEAEWRALHESAGLPVHIFRLAGIYGPGRNQLAALRDGTARRIVKPGQVFNRIHVDDIVGILDSLDGAATAGGGLQCLR